MGILRDSTKRQPDKIPAGWKTCREMAVEDGLSYSYANQLLHRLVEDGRVEQRKFLVLGKDGVVRPSPFYKPTK